MATPQVICNRPPEEECEDCEACDHRSPHARYGACDNAGCSKAKCVPVLVIGSKKEKPAMDAKKALSVVNKVLDDFDVAFTSEDIEAVGQARDALAEKSKKECKVESSKN